MRKIYIWKCELQKLAISIKKHLPKLEIYYEDQFSSQINSKNHDY
jgi:hypothetical protein